MMPLDSTACTAPISDETAKMADRKCIVRDWTKGESWGLMAMAVRRVETYTSSVLRFGWGRYGYQAVHRASGG